MDGSKHRQIDECIDHDKAMIDRNDDSSASADQVHRPHARLRRRGRAAMLRGVFFLPSMATLGNAVCGFSAVYICTLNPAGEADRWARFFAEHALVWAVYLVFLAAIFDVLDGRLARLTRHTTDFGGQLDSLADVISFGVAPAFIALQLFKIDGPESLPTWFSRLVWAIGAMYVACTAVRLARFNVTNDHAEQHHRSFQGLPSPGAGLAVLSVVLLHEQLVADGFTGLARVMVWTVPAVLFTAALLMVSEVRYPHLMNTVLRGRKSLWKLVVGLMLGLLLAVQHAYTIGIATLAFMLIGPLIWIRFRRREVFSNQPSPDPSTAN
jgi:CDP-diacylglycerol---serine O-phosphatidyltransferase